MYEVGWWPDYQWDGYETVNSLGGSIGQINNDNERLLGCLTREGDDKEAKDINVVDHQGEWEVIKCKVDSGAVDWVTSPEVGAAFQMKASTASKNGVNYKAANGTLIKNYGERVIQGLTEDWSNVEVAMQVADVKSTLGSVWRITQAGNKVVFGDEGGLNYIENKQSGKKTWLNEVNGSYEFDLWVAAKANQSVNQRVNQSVNQRVNQSVNQSVNQRVNAVKVSNKFEALTDNGNECAHCEKCEKGKADKKGGSSQDFPWLDEIFA
jgi:hypothetical protein